MSDGTLFDMTDKSDPSVATPAEIEDAGNMLMSGFLDAAYDFDEARILGGEQVNKAKVMRKLADKWDAEGDSGREQRNQAEQERLGKLVAKHNAKGAKKGRVR